MAITVVSSASPSNALAALTGSTASTESGASGFGSLFAQFMAGDAATESALFAQDIQALQPLAGNNEDAAEQMLTSLLPESIHAILESARKGRKNEEEDVTDTGIGLLGSLQTPVTTSSTSLVLESSTAALGQAGLAEQSAAEAALLKQQNSANLAAPDGNFSELLREPAAAATGSVSSQNPLQQSSAAAPELRTPLNDSRWSQEFGEKIVWMARNDQQQAQLSLNPANLGPLQITLSLDADKASALFTAATPEVRQAIEDALPRLREMLSATGISLGQTHVGTQAQQEQGQQGRNPSQGRGDKAILGADSNSQPLVTQQRGIGMVDLFA